MTAVMLHYNTIQYNTIQYNTIRYNTIQYEICVCDLSPHEKVASLGLGTMSVIFVQSVEKSLGPGGETSEELLAASSLDSALKAAGTPMSPPEMHSTSRNIV